MRRSLATALLGLLVIGRTVAADDANPNYTPPLERGFMADKVYQTGDVDHVDLFTRSLSLTIPVGPTFQVGGHLTYQLMLAYSMQGWDVGYYYHPDGNVYTKAEVSKLWNAGMGWRLSMGNFLAWNDPEAEAQGDRWVGPDGSSHAFRVTLHKDEFELDPDPGYWFTRDGSYLRLQKDDTPGAEKRIVDFPDGSSQTFERDIEGGETKWRLTHGQDAYGNYYDVAYLESPDRWEITDSDGRKHTVYTAANGRVNSVTLDSDDRSAIGSQDYVLQYAPTSIKRNCQDHRPGVPTRVTVDLLTQIDLPDGSSYLLHDALQNPSYHLECTWQKQLDPLETVTVNDLPGVIKGIRLPTGGRIEWDVYRDWYNSTEGTVPECPAPLFPEMCQQGNVTLDLEWAAIGARRVLDASGNTTATWHYASSGPTWPGDSVGCQHPGDYCSIDRERVVVVTDPAGNDSAYYFRAHPDSSLVFKGEYGLASTARVPDPLPETPSWDNPPRYLSEQHYQGTVQKTYDTTGHTYLPVFDDQNELVPTEGCTPACEPKRRVYRAYRSDTEGGSDYTFEPGARTTNRHLVSERTVHLDDPDHYAKTTYKGFDGLGHFRTTVLESNFTGSVTQRTAFTGYNPRGGTYLDYRHVPPADPVEITWQAGKPWIIGTLDRARTTDGARTVGSSFCFERDGAGYPTTGFLRAKRTLLADQNADPTVADTLGAHDSLAVFTRDSEGRVTAEEYLGGALHTGAFPAYCAGATSPVGSEEYRVDHTYTYDQPGQPAGQMLYTASYFNPSQPFTFYIRDLTIDKLSGLVTASRQASGPDTAGLEKLYEYDSMGRIAAEKPVQGAWTAYQYTNATGATPASVDVRVRPNGATTGTTLSAATYLYDPIGRLQTTKRQLADGSWSKQLIEYDGLGRKLRVSEVQAESVADGNLKKTLLEYDPFGRVTKTTAPDGSVVTTAYTGARQTARTVSVDGQPSTTTETYDGQGRLVKVVEPIAGSSSTTAQYTYDVSGKIATVTQTATGTSTTQPRTFTYDGAGQLTAETMPEVTGTITYGGYDARGHLLSRADAVNTLTFAYDKAERPLTVKESTPTTQRVIKAFTYGTPDDGYADYGNGKLRQATRHNYYNGLTSSDVTTVKQTNVYNGSFGRVSQRDTEVSGTMYAQPRTFTQSFAWTDLGLLDHQEYPRCNTAPCSTALPARTVYHQYANGALTGVLPYYAQGITYLPNGMASVLTMPRRVPDVTAGATVTQTVDTGTWMARPATITARDAAEAVAWGGGTYQYDGVGNITAIGTDDYAYDLASRLTGADLTVNGVAKSDDYTYDPFGNLTQVDRTDNGVSATRKIAISEATNHFLSTCTPPGGGTCWKGTHDDAGNVTSLQQDTNTLTLEYGSSNETRRSVLLGVEHRYAYDSDGERVAVWRSGEGTTFTLRDLAGKVLREVVDDGSGAVRWKEDYVWRDGALLATVSADGGLKHYALDHLGTPRLVTDRCGLTAARHDYFPYGEEATSPTQDAERMKFTGHERDFGGSASTLDDLDYMHARYYSSIVARFLSVDPLGGMPGSPRSSNRYGYTASNPICATDPDGRRPIFLGKNSAGHVAELPLMSTERAAMQASLERIKNDGSSRLRTLVENFEGPDRDVAIMFVSASGLPYGENSPGATQFLDKDAAENGTGSESLIMLLVGLEGDQLDDILTHELSHAEDNAAGTRAVTPEGDEGTPGTEGKAVRMQNQQKQHSTSPITTYNGYKVRDPQASPPVPKPRVPKKRIRNLGEPDPAGNP